jgi:hypothetical protein
MVAAARTADLSGAALVTTTSIRPNSSFASGITVVGAATDWQAFADESDASYVVFPSGAVATYGFATFTLPTGAVITGVANTSRVSGPAFATGPCEIGIYRPTASSWYPTAFTGVVSNFVNYYTDNAGVQPSTQVDIDDYVLNVGNNIGGTETANVYRLAVDVSYALAPTVTVSQPTGTITVTNSPAAVWAHASSEGLAQAAYQLKVFTFSPPPLTSSRCSPPRSTAPVGSIRRRARRRSTAASCPAPRRRARCHRCRRRRRTASTCVRRSWSTARISGR